VVADAAVAKPEGEPAAVAEEPVAVAPLERADTATAAPALVATTPNKVRVRLPFSLKLGGKSQKKVETKKEEPVEAKTEEVTAVAQGEPAVTQGEPAVVFAAPEPVKTEEAQEAPAAAEGEVAPAAEVAQVEVKAETAAPAPPAASPSKATPVRFRPSFKLKMLTPFKSAQKPAVAPGQPKEVKREGESVPVAEVQASPEGQEVKETPLKSATKNSVFSGLRTPRFFSAKKSPAKQEVAPMAEGATEEEKKASTVSDDEAEVSPLPVKLHPSPVKKGCEKCGSEEKHVAVRWVPNAERPACNNCKSSWTIFRWRHHCRSCGEIVCGNCCANGEHEMCGGKQVVTWCNTCIQNPPNPITYAERP